MVRHLNELASAVKDDPCPVRSRGINDQNLRTRGFTASHQNCDFRILGQMDVLPPHRQQAR